MADAPTSSGAASSAAGSSAAVSAAASALPHAVAAGASSASAAGAHPGPHIFTRLPSTCRACFKRHCVRTKLHPKPPLHPRRMRRSRRPRHNPHNAFSPLLLSQLLRVLRQRCCATRANTTARRTCPPRAKTSSLKLLPCVRRPLLTACPRFCRRICPKFSGCARSCRNARLTRCCSSRWALQPNTRRCASLSPATACLTATLASLLRPSSARRSATAARQLLPPRRRRSLAGGPHQVKMPIWSTQHACCAAGHFGDVAT